MLLIDIFWGRRKSIRADMSIFWTFCSGSVLTGISTTILFLVWQHIFNDGTLNPAEFEFFILVSCCLFVGCFVSALFGLALAWYLTIHYRRPLDAVSKVAQSIAFGDWKQRVKTETKNKELSALIAAFNRMCDQNEKAIDELRRAGDDLSHDLKTPLTHMQILTERMTKNSTIPQEMVLLLRNSITYMKDTVDTILDISRTEHRIDMPLFAPVDMRSIVDSSIELYSGIATERHIRLEKILPEIPAIVSGSRTRLSRVLSNLLDNSFRFTQDGGRISVILLVSPSVITLKISDSGIGISKKDIPYIFNRFYRSRAILSRPDLQTGHGLGLSLVKAIVESYQGKITVCSIPNQETIFTLSFPRQATVS